MKRQGQSASSGKSERPGLVLRFTLGGAALGFAVGLYEAGLLYFTPRLPTLLEPDVRYVIWFLAPLLSLSIFTLLGAGLGLGAVVGKHAHPWRTVILASVGVGAAGFYTALAAALSQLWTLDRFALRRLTVPCWSFLAVFISAVIILGAWQRCGRFLRAATSWAPQRPAGALLGALVFCVLGLVLFAARLSLRSAPAVSAQPKPGPNVVMIVLDTVRADELSAYGYARSTTPNLDRLARRGVLFENAIAPSSWTLPSDISMLTGLLPHQHGANWSAPLVSGVPTLAEHLETHGYETAGFNANLVYGLTGWGLGRGFEHYDDDSSSLRHNLETTIAGRVLVQPLYERLVEPNSFDRRSARQLNCDVFRWFRRRSDRPFFLFVNYFDTHYPYVAPAPYDRRFGRTSRATIRRAANFEYRGGVPQPLREERGSVITAYDSCLAYLDDQVGQLLDFLARSPEWANTIVIVTSDHGEAFGEHNAYGHGINLYRETTHVPLIFFGPGIPAGLRVPHIARSREVFQTVIDLASIADLRFDRPSLRRFWTPGFTPTASDDVALSELVSVISMTTPEWHYLYHADGRSELFHWRTDPREVIDLSQQPEYQPTMGALQASLDHRVAISIPPWRGPDYLLGFKQPGLRLALARHGFVPESERPTMGARPTPENLELLDNLPYH